jgi:TetR/AcrR family acrAB operon transcriptional repressor
MRRTKEEAEQTRQTILDAALLVFSRDGFAASRLADIAAEAGVTRGAIYHHFENKADLYLALLERAEAEQQAVMEAAIAEGGSIADITRRIMARSFKTLARRPTFRNVMALSSFKVADSEELGTLTEKRRQEAVSLIEAIAGIMAEGIKVGVFRADLDPHTAARAFIAYQQGVIRLWLANPEAFSIEAEADKLAGIYMLGILA